MRVAGSLFLSQEFNTAHACSSGKVFCTWNKMPFEFMEQASALFLTATWQLPAGTKIEAATERSEECGKAKAEPDKRTALR